VPDAVFRITHRRKSMPGLPAIGAAVFTDGIRPPIPGEKSIRPISRFSTGQCQWFRRGKSARITWHWQATSNMAYSGAVTCCPAKRPSVYRCGDFSDLVVSKNSNQALFVAEQCKSFRESLYDPARVGPHLGTAPCIHY